MKVFRSGRRNQCLISFVLLLAVKMAVADETTAALKFKPATVIVETRELARINAPASVELAVLDGLGTSEKPPAVRLIEITGDKERPIASQVELSNAPRLWWIVDGTIPPNSKRTYRIEAAASNSGKAESTTSVNVDQNPDFVEFHIGTSPVLRYNSSHIEVTEAVDPRYGRSAYIHPAWTPAGAIVTDQFPPDHAHQSGIFLANVKTEFEGRSPDFWNLLGGTGRVRFKQIKKITKGPIFGELIVEHEHVDHSAPVDFAPNGKVAMLETWTVRVWNLNDPKPAFWVCDITSQMTCATSSPVRMKEYHYGGMALRGAREWTPANCQFVTSEGKDRIEGNHTRPRWCDLNGNVKGQPVGITFMTHAKNYRFPEPLRIHPKMPYMVYSSAHLGDWDLVPGQSTMSQYRFLFHDGEIPATVADRLSNDFSEPLVATPVATADRR